MAMVDEASVVLTDDEAKDLKTWIIKKLEDISDADSDVLADYVLALIRNESPESELRANAIENLEDFLKENTSSFVDQIFLAIHSKSYIPGYVPPPVSTFSTQAFHAPSGPTGFTSARGGHDGGVSQSRKRSYNDRQEGIQDYDPHYGRNDRQIKQSRRGNWRGGVSQGRPDRDFQTPLGLPGLGSPSSTGFSGMPMLPGMGFDPSDPLGAILSMQAMGFPPLPGMPHLPQVRSPTGNMQHGGTKMPMQTQMGKTKISARCRDYDTKGFCTRGESCPFEHGNHIVIPGQQEEYDPKNSTMMDIQKPNNGTNGHSHPDPSHGSFRGQGRGHNRGDRGGFVTQRRNNRAEFSQAGPNQDRSITTVVVEQIPEENFDERSVQDFFSDFGKIEKVTMQAYKRLALVKFEDFFSAKRAYESPKVIFDNRFVKVYWYNPDKAHATPTNGSGNTAKSPKIEKSEEPAFDREKFERDAQTAQKKLEERQALQREADAKRQELERQKEELERRKEEEKKKLHEKLRAKGLLSAEADPAPASENIKMEDSVPDSKASAQTEMLKKKLAELEAEAVSLGLDPEPWATRGRGRGRGRGSYRGWEGFAGRGAAHESRGAYRGRGSFRGRGGAYNLDNRSRKVRVEGVIFDDGRDESLRQFLLGVGEFSAIEPVLPAKDAQIVTFKDRFTAEKFLFGPKDIPGVGPVDFSWVNAPPHSSAAALPLPTPTPQDEKPDADTDMAGASADGDTSREAGRPAAVIALAAQEMGAQDVDYDVAEDDDRWMVS